MVLANCCIQSIAASRYSLGVLVAPEASLMRSPMVHVVVRQLVQPGRDRIPAEHIDAIGQSIPSTSCLLDALINLIASSAVKIGVLAGIRDAVQGYSHPPT